MIHGPRDAADHVRTGGCLDQGSRPQRAGGDTVPGKFLREPDSARFMPYLDSVQLLPHPVRREAQRRGEREVCGVARLAQMQDRRPRRPEHHTTAVASCPIGQRPLSAQSALSCATSRPSCIDHAATTRNRVVASDDQQRAVNTTDTRRDQEFATSSSSRPRAGGGLQPRPGRAAHRVRPLPGRAGAGDAVLHRRHLGM